MGSELLSTQVLHWALLQFRRKQCGDIETQLLTGESQRYVAITTFSTQEAYRQENGSNVLIIGYNVVVNIC